jgi:deoxyribodipyrimidine photolyase
VKCKSPLLTQLLWHQRGLLGPGYYISRLSPYLATGSLSPKEVAKTLLRYEDD